MEISPEIDKKCDELIARYPRKKSAAMLILHLIQEKLGYFDDDAIKFAAGKLGVRPIEVYGMISFYPMFSTAPRGRIHIKVCRTLSCAMAGSVKLGHEISKLVNCPIGETRGIYTLEFVECLGNCVKAPNVQVNDKLFENGRPRGGRQVYRKNFRDGRGRSLAPAPFDAEPNAEGDFESPAYKG